MSIISMIIVGLIVGVVAKLIMPGRDGGGFVTTTLLGIVGAMLAGFIGQALGLYNSGEPAGFIASVIGAIALLGIYKVATGRVRSY